MQLPSFLPLIRIYGLILVRKRKQRYPNCRLKILLLPLKILLYSRILKPRKAILILCPRNHNRIPLIRPQNPLRNPPFPLRGALYK